MFLVLFLTQKPHYANAEGNIDVMHILSGDLSREVAPTCLPFASDSFEQVEAHPAFGRGTVRAARINKLLMDPSWNWCGFANFYTGVAVLGIVVLVVLDQSNANSGFSNATRWTSATLVLPGVLTLLKLLFQVP